jgi:hypothetical protein
VRFLSAGDELTDMPLHLYWSFSFAGLWFRLGVLAVVVALIHSGRAVA